jgi:small subunit ribosomal protein S1
MNSESKLSQTANSSFSMDDFAKALEKHDYQFQKGQVVRGKIFQVDHDGAYVDIGGKSSAFLPQEEASLRAVTDLSEILPMDEELEFLIIRDQDAEGQVTISRKQLEMRQIWEKLAEIQENALKGQSLTVGFLEINRETNKLVLSQRLAARSSNFSLLEIGQLIEGKITGIKPFGVFVDFNGVSALLHIKQVSQKFIESLDKVFQIGQPIKAVIIDLDEGKGRVAISTRVLENHPGEVVENFAEVMASAESRANRAANKTAE